MTGKSSTKKSEPRVAVLMSVYNGGKYLDQQLQSIFGQTIGSDQIAIYVRDDGSSDCTAEILEKWKDRFPRNFFLERGKNVGAAQSFWKLLNKNIEAEYFAFSDQDDVWYPDKLERALAFLESNKKDVPMLYYSNARLVDADLNDMGADATPKGQSLSAFKILAGISALGCTMVFNRETKKFAEDSSLQAIEMHDKSLLLLTYLAGCVLYDDRPGLAYRQHGDNVVGMNVRGTRRLWARWRRTYKRWFCSKAIRLSSQAEELLDLLGEDITEEQKSVLQDFVGYRKHVSMFWRLWKNEDLSDLPFRVRRSFRMRLVMRLI